jgi:hypothetical protein
VKFGEGKKERKFHVHTCRNRYGWGHIKKLKRSTQTSMDMCVKRGNINTDGYGKGDTCRRSNNGMDTGLCV